jgi:hypothetical protein
MPSYEAVDYIEGIGHLYFHETPVCPVRYRLGVWHGPQRDATRPRAQVPHIQGHVRPLDSSSDPFFLWIGRPLTLRLTDGRRWDCVVLDVAGWAIEGLGGRGLYHVDVD